MDTFLDFLEFRGNRIHFAHSPSQCAFWRGREESFLPYEVSMCFSYFRCSAVFAIFSEFKSLISWWECRFNDIYFGKHVLLKFCSNVSRLILKLAAEANAMSLETTTQMFQSKARFWGTQGQHSISGSAHF